MTDKDAILQSAGVPIYTVVHTAVDADHGEFPDPVNFGSFLSYLLSIVFPQIRSVR